MEPRNHPTPLPLRRLSFRVRHICFKSVSTMWTSNVMLICLLVDRAACLYQDKMVLAGQALSVILKAGAKGSCSLITVTDSKNDGIFVLQTEWQAQWLRRGASVFQMVGDQEPNTTRHFSQLIPLASRVRQFSSCTMVVVVSHDLAFLAAFAKWSQISRLLVFDTRLVVVTSLVLAQLEVLLPAHWTFSMMNTIFFILDDTSHSYQVLSHVPYSKAGPHVAKVASWTHSRGLLFTEGCTLFQEKYSNFHGASVNVTALPFAPFWEEREGPGDTTQYFGTDYNTLAAIASALNFTIHVVPTNSWTEVTQLVEERVSFMAPIIHNLMPQRRERYDFSFVYEYVSMDFSMAPPGLQIQWGALYYPLSGPVWMATLLSLFFVLFILFFVIRAGRNKTHPFGSSRLEFADVFQDILGILLGQNLPHNLPSTSSSRVLVAAWLFFAIILASAFRGNLTASLTLPKFPPRPETLPQLVHSVERITMQPFGAEFKKFFSQSKSPLFQKLASLIDIVSTLMVGQQQAIKHNQAHLDNRRYQLYNIAKKFTRMDGSKMLYIGRESIMPGQSAWPLPHDAPYAATIDRHLMAVVEAGLYEKWASDLLFEVQQESRKQQLAQLSEAEQMAERPWTTVVALTIGHMQGAFMLLVIGLLLSATVFGGELIISHFG